VNPKL